MSGTLFAFKMSQPIATTPADEPFGGIYDPQTQTSTWHGDGQSRAAAYCTMFGSHEGYQHCWTYGEYCGLDQWGSHGFDIGYYGCD